MSQIAQIRKTHAIQCSDARINTRQVRDTRICCRHLITLRVVPITRAKIMCQIAQIRKTHTVQCPNRTIRKTRIRDTRIISRQVPNTKITHVDVLYRAIRATHVHNT